MVNNYEPPTVQKYYSVYELRRNLQILCNKTIDFTSNFDDYLIGNIAPIIKRTWELVDGNEISKSECGLEPMTNIWLEN